MSWKLEVQASGDDKWHRNSRLFPTREEAEAHARDLMSCWMHVRDYRAIEVDELINYQWKSGCLLTRQSSATQHSGNPARGQQRPS